MRVLHLATDAETGHIIASALTDSDADDGSQVGSMRDQVNGPVAPFTGDGAHDRDDVYTAVAIRHPEAAVIVPPRGSTSSATALAGARPLPASDTTAGGPASAAAALSPLLIIPYPQGPLCFWRFAAIAASPASLVVSTTSHVMDERAWPPVRTVSVFLVGRTRCRGAAEPRHLVTIGQISCPR
jgi:hypothetical protein